jgi:hypothetical protein
MHGSPSIRIDGEDLDPSSIGPVGLHPRDYGHGPVPDKELIRRAVQRARGWAHAPRD